MNATRRKLIEKAIGTLQELASEIESAGNDEREQFDNMGERAQEGERGQKIDQAASDLESAYSNLESAISDLENAISE